MEPQHRNGDAVDGDELDDDTNSFLGWIFRKTGMLDFYQPIILNILSWSVSLLLISG